MGALRYNPPTKIKSIKAPPIVTKKIYFKNFQDLITLLCFRIRYPMLRIKVFTIKFIQKALKKLNHVSVNIGSGSGSGRGGKTPGGTTSSIDSSASTRDGVNAKNNINKTRSLFFIIINMEI